jgi:hypothetical protein
MDYTLSQIIGEAIRTALTWLQVALPGRVKSYDADKGCADIELTVKLPVRSIQDLVSYFTLPLLAGVPVAWPSGGGYFVGMPLAVGDPVFLVFSDTPMGEYLETGEVSEPLDVRRHSLGYPICIPGGARPDKKAIADLPTDGLIIGKDGANTQIKVTATDILIGKGATQHAAIAELVDANIAAIVSALAGASPTIPVTLPSASTQATLVKIK